MKDEPVITGAAIISLAGAIITLLTAFGVVITPDQQTAILKIVVIVAPLVVAYFVRRKVTPTGAP